MSYICHMFNQTFLIYGYCRFCIWKVSLNVWMQERCIFKNSFKIKNYNCSYLVWKITSPVGCKASKQNENVKIEMNIFLNMFVLGVKPLCLVYSGLIPYLYSRFRYQTHPIYSYIANLPMKTKKSASSFFVDIKSI